MSEDARDAYPDLLDESEESKGVHVKQEDLFIDLGQTGLKRSAGIVDEEFLPALRGPKGVKVYNEMWQNNSTISALIFAIQMLLSQVKWTVTIKNHTPEGEKAVQFLESCMDDMSQPWSSVIEEILSCVVYGWSYHEIVYKRRVGPWEQDASKRSKYSDGLIGWRKLPIRAQETMFRWAFDDHGGIKGMVQMAAPSYKSVFIPVEKALLFRVGAHKNSPEGRSLLRGAYRSWYWVKRMEELEAVSVERDMAGMPVAKIPSRIMTSPDPKDQKMFKAFKELVRNIRRDTHQGVVLPSDTDEVTKQPLYTLELLSSTGSHTIDTSNIIGRLQKDMLMTVMADFLLMGATSTGSYAMHVDKTGIFKRALNSIANSIADVFNRHAIPRLFAINGWKPEELPQFKPEPVENPNLQELASAMTSMTSMGMEFFPDADLEKYIRSILGLPEMSVEKEEALQDKEERAIKDSYIDSETQSMEKENTLQQTAEAPEKEEEQRMMQQEQHVSQLSPQPGVAGPNSAGPQRPQGKSA